MDNDIREYIVKEIKKKGPIPENVNIDDMDYIAGGYIDSIAMMRFVVLLEEKFGIEFSEEEITSQEFRTVRGLANIIEKKRNAC